MSSGPCRNPILQRHLLDDCGDERSRSGVSNWMSSRGNRSVGGTIVFVDVAVFLYRDLFDLGQGADFDRRPFLSLVQCGVGVRGLNPCHSHGRLAQYNF